jgi:DNA polymerase-3 subunit epsilon
VYAVIDLETTGLNPLRHDRIVEIAVVHVNADGDVTGEWTTLVNPSRDLGPQHIHGITAADARRAPSFAQLAPTVAGMLQGRVVVAHNLAFDAPFLAHQFRALGVEVPLSLEAGLCTMMLAATYLPESGRSLAACCAAAGVPLDHAHCALDDTRAAAMLLGHYIRAAGQPVPWQALVDAGAAMPWPSLASSGPIAAVSRRGRGMVPPSFLGRLVEALPRVPGPPAFDSYLAVLDRALVDRQISETEADALVDLAKRLKLSRRRVVALHRDYLGALAAAALADGVVAADEEQELRAVAELLGLPADAVAAALHPDSVRVPRQPARRFRLRARDEVVFTGQTQPPRDDLERRARDAGLTVSFAVTQSTRLLVAADVDTMSGKARAARDYGVPIVGPMAFERFVAAMTGAGGTPDDEVATTGGDVTNSTG